MSVFWGEAQRWAFLGCRQCTAGEQSTGVGSIFNTTFKVLEVVHLNTGNILEPDKITTRETNWLICEE